MIEHPDCGGEATTDGSVKCRVVGREDSDNLRWDRIVQEGSSIGGIEWECWMARLGRRRCVRYICAMVFGLGWGELYKEGRLRSDHQHLTCQ